ncbi:MAG: hypothetical protein ABEK29_02530 [Bradymonadaceae bacterium]
MSDTSDQLEEIKQQLDEHEQQMGLFARGFSPVMMLLLLYIILALIGIVPGFPGVTWALLPWIIVRFAVPFLHPDLRRRTELQKKVLQLQTDSDE